MPRLRRPCQPAITVLARRLASTMQSGIRAARACARESTSRVGVGWTIWPTDAMRSLPRSAACLPDEACNDVTNRHALGAGAEGQRHAVLEDGFGERQNVVDGGREAAFI